MNPDSVDDWIDSLWQGGLVEPGRLNDLAVGGRAGGTASITAIAADLVRRGVLTSFQADECLAGRGSELAVGPYRLLEPLEPGRQGLVFLARHNVTNQVVVLKRFPPERLPWADATGAYRFHREAEAAARLRHPHLVRVLDDGRSGAVHYLVMERAAGIGLPAFLVRQGPLEPLQACRYAEQTARALQYAYEHGLVPCEIAASDLIVTDRGDSVKLLSAGRGRFGATASGLGEFDLGSLLEPGVAVQDEVAATRDAEALREDAQSAIFGLGRVLRGMVSGRSDRDDDEAELPLPAGLAAIVEKMVADDPAQRYATPADCAEALACFCSLPTTGGREAGAATAPPEAPKPGGPSWVRCAAAFTAMIFLGAVAGAATTWFSSETPATSTPPPAPSPRPLASSRSGLAPLPTIIRRAENRAPEDPRYGALVQAGTAALNRDAIPEALVNLGAAIRLRPDLATAYRHRAEAQSRWEAYREAVADSNQAIRLDPLDPVAFRLRGAALACLGDDEGAIADATQAIALDARDAHAFNTRGVAHFNRQEFHSARDDFIAAVGIDETLAVALGNLAWLLATAPESGIRNGSLAIEHAQRACELTDWSDPAQLKNLAAAHAVCHDFDQAVPFQKQALAQGRSLPGTVIAQYRALLNLYLAGQSPPHAGSPLPAPPATTHQGQDSPRSATAPAAIRRGAGHPARPSPSLRAIPRTAPPPFVPLYRSGHRLNPGHDDGGASAARGLLALGTV